MKLPRYCLLGSSASGKTTLLSCVVGMKKLDSGSIKVSNAEVGKNKSNIGFMPQSFSLIDEFTIKELIFFFGTIYGLSKIEITNRFNYLVDLLELKNTENLIKNCSGGEKRRISLAVCMIHQPKILILGKLQIIFFNIFNNS